MITSEPIKIYGWTVFDAKEVKPHIFQGFAGRGNKPKVLRPIVFSDLPNSYGGEYRWLGKVTSNREGTYQRIRLQSYDDERRVDFTCGSQEQMAAALPILIEVMYG